MIELDEQLKRDIGQHFVFGFHGQDVSEDIKTLITKYFLGNVILMKRNIHDIQQVHCLVEKLQRIARDAGHVRPLMIGIDQENGLVSAFSASDCGTLFPGAMALAACGSVSLAEKVSNASAMEMKKAGINWAYSPVADVNTDPRNPVIGVRSFGDDPQEVARYVCAVSKGLTDVVIAPSAKHFPGHGNTRIDSHIGLPRIMCSKEDLTQTELVPFKALIDRNVASIMTGHMALPLITGDELPCSLSRKITTELLRNELAFDGVIVTDCLEMEAVAQKYGSDGGAVIALQAGADIVMICHTMSRQQGAVEMTYAAVMDGSLSLDELQKGGKRIATLKDAFTGSWDDVLDPTFDTDEWNKLKDVNVALSRQAYQSAATLHIDPANVLPLSRTSGPVVVFTPRMESINLAVDDEDAILRSNAGHIRNTAGPSYCAFAAAIAERTPMHHVVYAPENELPQFAKDCVVSAASVVFATRNGLEKGAWQMEVLRQVVQTLQHRPLIVVSTCAPYDVLNLNALPGAILATMEFTTPALETAVEVIFGEVEAKGTLPVHVA